MSAPAVRRPDAGFTLVEAMVSLFVFSLVAAGCVLMLMQSVDSQRRVGEAHEALREVQSAKALLTADLAQYAARMVREPNDMTRPAFIGGDSEIALGFVRASGEPDPEFGPRTSLQVVEYRLRDGQLVRLSRTSIDPGPEVEMIERVVLADAADAHFEFFDGVEWRAQWLSPVRGTPPPRAVALVFTSPRYGDMRIVALTGVS